MNGSVSALEQSGGNNLVAADNLKQNLYDYGRTNLPKGVNDSIYGGMRGDISAVDPKYADLMENYKAASDNINDLTKTFSLGNGAAASTSVVKGLTALKSGSKMNSFRQLIAKDPTIGGMIAGAAIQPWSNHSSIWEALASGYGLASLAHPGGLAVGIPGAMAGFVASSPRIVGSAAYLAGKVTAPLNAVTSPLGNVATKAAYYASRPEALTQQVPGPATNSPAPTGAWNAVKRLESHGHQIDPRTGQPTTSSKGAIGVSQIMPKNGPAAAAMAGVPWDPDKFKWDQDYNETLGQAFYHHLVDEWGGDTVKAAAAYNSGSARVHQAMAAAAQQGDDWVAHLPQETRNYVRNFRSATGAAASGGRIERAAGGAIDTGRRDELVERLMGKTKQAKASWKRAIRN